MFIKRLTGLTVLILSLQIAASQPKFNIYKGDTINRTDSKGLKQGVWMKFYNTDTVYYKGRFINGKPTGLFIHYYPSGKKQSETIHRSPTKAYFKGYYENGQLMARGLYLNQNKDSVWLYYWENDTVSAEESYKNGVANGNWNYFYRNGKLSEIMPYVNGQRHGVNKQYFKDGTLKVECAFKNDKRHGLYRSYYSNGKPYLEGVYASGERNGVWMLHDETGKVIARDEYKDGVCPNITITEDLMAQ